MTSALKTPRGSHKAGTAHGSDLYTWVQEQVAHLRAGRVDLLDLENIAEELSDVGKSEYRELQSAITLVILHLLKWDYQPDRRSRSWTLSIAEHRDRFMDVLSESPGLKARLQEATAKAYQSGRRSALEETGLATDAIPDLCPYSWDEISNRPIVYDPAQHRLRD